MGGHILPFAILTFEKWQRAPRLLLDINTNRYTKYKLKLTFA
jgi:hypothetical protein